MKRKLPLIFGALFLVFAATACEGPQGPPGEKGDTGDVGPVGPKGDPGEDGTNALNTCSDCHTADPVIVAIEQAFALSEHGFGNFEVRGPAYAGGSCAACHTSQGFVANATGGTADYSAGVASMNCRTCHDIHSTYEGADYALTTTDPVDLIVTGNQVDFGNGNLCASCHQGRDEDAYPTYNAPVDSLFEIPSTHYDFHYGVQTNVVTAEFPDSVLYGLTQGTTFGSHSAATCTDCHMGIGDAVAGFDLPVPLPGGTLGHNYMPDEEVCNSCHTNDVTDEGFDHNDVRTDVGTVLTGLQACLAAEGVIDAATGDYHPVVDDDATAGVNEGEHPEPYVAAFLVFHAVEHDGSMGAHNPSFVKAWIDAAATAMDTNSTNAACDYTSPF